MGLAVRFYLFAEDGLQRISHRLMEGLAHGQDAMPQYSGTKQKAANVLVEMDGGKPVKIVRADGDFLVFDEKGQVHRNLVASGFAAMETGDALERADRRPAGKVVDLGPKLNREKWERENRWNLSKKDLDLIADDIWKRKRAAAPKVQQAKGVVPKTPAVTWEAKQALHDIQDQVIRIDIRLDRLTEPALKGFAFEARKRSKDDFDNGVWRGVAEAADRRREILARYRTGAGVWYGYVEMMHWDVGRNSGHSVSIIHERCNSKKEAEEAAQRLLAENAKHFRVEMSVEARVVCELEWEDDGEYPAPR
jgi:hypothetical protein